MHSIEPSPSSSTRSGVVFATSHWSVVLAARQIESPRAYEALENLCRSYWRPLYGFLRRSGHGHHDAQDLTQGFFAHLLQRNFLETVGPAKGKFRSFLLASLKNFLADEHDRSTALKRGGGQQIISLDDQDAEQRYAVEPVTKLSPDKIFERRWALTLLDHARGRLKAEYEAAGKGELYQYLRRFDSSEQSSPTYAEAAAKTGLPENTVKSAVHRMRKRYRELVREEIAHTVSNPDEVDEEIHYLLDVMSV